MKSFNKELAKRQKKISGSIDGKAKKQKAKNKQTSATNKEKKKSPNNVKNLGKKSKRN